LTLAELAEKIGLSASHLSQIEQDKKMPSLLALTDIAEALEINPRDLLKPDSDPVHIMPTPPPASNIDVPPLISNQILTSPSSGSDLEVQRLVLQPGAPDMAFEPHSGEIFGYVLEGRLLVTLEAEQIELSTGDSIHYDANQSYHLHGLGSSPCVLLWGSSPPSNELAQKIASALGEATDVDTLVELT
jgi:mannose-6-phosphate isomerase-like protein (cupin superfamily)